MQFDLNEREREGVKIIDVDGRLVLGGPATELRDRIKSLQDAGTRQLVLNLEYCDYIDSTGLGTLVMTATSMQRAAGGMKLLRLNKRNLELMVITKLTTIFEIFNDETDAVNSFFPDRKINRFDILSFVKDKK
jgi:anti-sigma B factor antagonist